MVFRKACRICKWCTIIIFFFVNAIILGLSRYLCTFLLDNDGTLSNRIGYLSITLYPTIRHIFLISTSAAFLRNFMLSLMLLCIISSNRFNYSCLLVYSFFYEAELPPHHVMWRRFKFVIQSSFAHIRQFTRQFAQSHIFLETIVLKVSVLGTNFLGFWNLLRVLGFSHGHGYLC